MNLSSIITSKIGTSALGWIIFILFLGALVFLEAACKSFTHKGLYSIEASVMMVSAVCLCVVWGNIKAGQVRPLHQIAYTAPKIERDEYEGDPQMYTVRTLGVRRVEIVHHQLKGYSEGIHKVRVHVYYRYKSRYDKQHFYSHKMDCLLSDKTVYYVPKNIKVNLDKGI